MLTEEKVQETIEHTSFTAFLRSDGIVHFTMKEIEDYTVEIAKDQNQLLQKFGGGNKMPVMISFKSYNPPNEESMQYGSSEEGSRYSKANAIVVDSLALRIGANFYLNFFKPKVPTRLFNSEQGAVKWLKKFV